jgi:hypothetical protein
MTVKSLVTLEDFDNFVAELEMIDAPAMAEFKKLKSPPPGGSPWFDILRGIFEGQPSVTLDDMVTELNNITSSNAPSAFINARVPVSKELACHPTLMVLILRSSDGAVYLLGPLGFVNGLFGLVNGDSSPIGVVRNKEKRIIAFRKSPLIQMMRVPRKYGPR